MTDQIEADEQTPLGTLKIGEIHPMAHDAFHYVKQYLLTNILEANRLMESFASCAIEGNRLGEICSETMRRIMHGEAISDRYLFGLAWFLRNMEDDKK